MSQASPIVPVMHAFEWDASGGRIVGLRFRMCDGTERVVGARVVEVTDQPAPAPAVIELEDADGVA